VRQASRLHAWIVPVLITVSSCAALAGCSGQTRSVAAYCSYFYGEGTQLRDRFIKANSTGSQDPFAGLSNVFADMAEAASFLHQLSQRAPHEIAPDVELLAKALDKASEQSGSAAADPLGALASGLVAGISTGAAEQRVNEYTLRHCGSPPGAASTATGTSTSTSSARAANPATANTVRANGTTLASVSDPGTASAVADIGGMGFSIVDDAVSLQGEGQEGKDESSVAVYTASGEQLTTLPAVDLTGACGVADVTVPDLGRTILTELVTTHPAAGIKPATSEVALKAWRASTGEPEWSATIAPSATGPPRSCSQYTGSAQADVATLERFVTLPNGRWALVTAGNQPYVVNLATGKLRADTSAKATLGNYIYDEGSNESPGYLTDPETGHRVGGEPGLGHGREATRIQYYTSELALAPSGLVRTESDGTSPPAVLSSDGERVIGIVEGGTEAKLAAYSLPDGAMRWQRPFSVYLYGDAGGRVIIGENSELVALNDRTGATEWHIPISAADVCGITSHQLLVDTNGQLAILDSTTGRQLSYESGGSEDNGSGEVQCASILLGGGLDAGANSGSGDLTVTQRLQP
jgi:hypothetical protein